MRAPDWVVPALVLVAAAAGVGGSRLLAAPSLEEIYAVDPPRGGTQTVTFLVQGVRCVDTAELAARQLDGEPGVIRLAAWPARARLEITFDPTATDVRALHEAIEAPAYQESTGEFIFGVYQVREIDGVRVEK